VWPPFASNASLRSIHFDLPFFSPFFPTFSLSFRSFPNQIPNKKMFKMDTQQMQFNPFAAASTQQQQFEMQQQQQQQEQMLLFQQQMQMQQQQQHFQQQQLQQSQHMSLVQHDDEEMEEDAEMTEMKTSDSQLGFGQVQSQPIPSHPFAHLNQHTKSSSSPLKSKMNEPMIGRRAAHAKSAVDEQEEADESEYDEDEEEEDEDDFDELDEQMMRQMMMNASPDSQNVIKLIISGYSACASETLRYLIEEENLPANSPTLIGLIKHLKMQETMLIMNCLRTQHLQQQLIAQQQQLLQQQAQQQSSATTPLSAQPTTTPAAQTQMPSAQQLHLLQQQQQQQQALLMQQQRLQAAALNLPSPPHSHGSQSNSPGPLSRGHSPSTLSPLSSGQSSPARLGSPPAHPASAVSSLQAKPFGAAPSQQPHPPSTSLFSNAAPAPLSNFGSTMNAFGAQRQPSAAETTSGPFGGFRMNASSGVNGLPHTAAAAANTPNHPFANQAVLSSFSRTPFSNSC
jgi:hypothetical protein